MKTHLHSFYWVASSSSAPDSPAFHCNVIVEAESMEEAAALGGLKVERQLNMAAAEEAGITLETIAAAIATDAAARLELQRAQLQDQAGQLEEQSLELDARASRIASLEALLAQRQVDAEAPAVQG